MKKYVILLLIFISCSKEVIPPIDEYADCKLKVFEYYESKEISKYHISKADPITGLIEGDIIPDKQNRAAIQVSRLWLNNTVPYFLNDDLGENKKSQIRNRIKNLENLTNLIFIEYSNTIDLLKAYKGGIHFRAPTNPFAGNSSYVGFQGGMQNLTLVAASLDHVIDHEILHAIAFEHTIKRSDRDKYIIMLWDNIPINPNIRKQFEIDTTAILCGGFKYDDVMLYGSYTGGWFNAEETNRPVYVDKKENIIPQPIELSIGNIETIKVLYPKIK